MPGLSRDTVRSSIFITLCGIQLPGQRSNPGPLHWECSLKYWATREVQRQSVDSGCISPISLVSRLFLQALTSLLLPQPCVSERSLWISSAGSPPIWEGFRDYAALCMSRYGRLQKNLEKGGSDLGVEGSLWGPCQGRTDRTPRKKRSF